MIITSPDQYKKLLNRLVLIIRNHAGKRCPTDKEFASMLGTKTNNISHAIEKLIRNRRIEKIGDQKCRNFKCLRTGRQTGIVNAVAPQKQRALKARDADRPDNHGVRWRPLPADVWYGGRDPDGRPLSR